MCTHRTYTSSQEVEIYAAAPPTLKTHKKKCTNTRTLGERCALHMYVLQSEDAAFLIRVLAERQRWKVMKLKETLS